MHCVAEATEQGGQVAEDKLREASAAIARLVRSQVVGSSPAQASNLGRSAISMGHGRHSKLTRQPLG